MGANEDLVHEWRFRIGDAFPADDPVARFVVAVAVVLNDTILSNTLFVDAAEEEHAYRRLYFFSLASSHLYEAAEIFLRAHREWDEVRAFVEELEQERQEEFDRIKALAAPQAPWPGQRLKEIRNAFFHYLRLDRAAYDAGQLPLANGLQVAADLESSLVIEPGAVLSGIRARFGDQAVTSAMTHDLDDGELERLIATCANLQGDLSRFAQAVVGRHIAELPDGVVLHETRPVAGEGHDD